MSVDQNYIILGVGKLHKMS